MEKSSSYLFKLGFFVTAGLVLMVLGTYYIGNEKNLFGSKIEITAVFSEVNGLKPGNNVRLSGVNVGTVNGVSIKNDSTIHVSISIQNDIFPFLYKNASASIGTDGLVGNMVLNLDAGEPKSGPLAAGALIYEEAHLNAATMLKTLGKTNENAALVMKNLVQITEIINSGKGTIGMLVQDSTLAKNFKRSVDDLNHITRKTAKTIDEIHLMITALKKDPSVYNLLKDTIFIGDIQATSKALQQSTKELNEVLRKADNIANDVQTSRGTYHYLIHDTTLVKTLSHGSMNLDSVIMTLNTSGKLLNENLEALKHNFLFRGYFKKLEKEKLKNQKKAKQ